MRWLCTLLVLQFSCAGDPPPDRLDGGADVGEEDAALDDAGRDSLFADTSALPDVPPLPCDDGFAIEGSARTGTPLVVRFTHPTAGLTNINLRTSGDGSPSSRFDELESDEAPFRWRFIVEGHAQTRLELELVADPEERVYGTCSVRVLEDGAGDGGTRDAGADAEEGDSCVPTCGDKLCGEDDGCGTPCAGGHRDAHGGVSDCRLGGNCGCGVEPNDNMECTGDGMCRIRCSCDCLPPQLRSAEAVAGLDHGGSCTLVFRESGDATVWDSVNERALCPTDYDPGGDAHCSECPPCHRGRDQCGLESWCECTDPGYRARDPQYNAMCGG